MPSATLTGLAIYPVKSLRGIALQTMQICDWGPQGDRRFMLIDSRGRFITQRQFARLCLIDVAPVDAIQGLGWMLSAPGQSPLRLDSTQAKPARIPVLVWRDTVAACDMGDAAAAWFSQYLGVQARLCLMPDDSVRKVDQTYAQPDDRVGFADGFPILLTAEASLAAINGELPAAIGMERFRPNIVIGGSAAYAEDAWKRIRIGALEFDVVKPCSRCVIPSIDTKTAEKQSIVTQTLARLRRRDNAVYFGQNLIARGTGTIALGDNVTVIA